MASSSPIGDLAVTQFEQGDATDIFKKPAENSSLRGFQELKIQALNTYNTRTNSIEFEFGATSPSGYLDLSSLRLQGHYYVTDAAGEAVGADIKVAPCNFASQLLFKNIELWVNGVLTSTVSSVPFGIKAYLEWILGYDQACLTSHGKSSLWTKDTTGKLDTFADANAGFAARATAIKTKKPIHFKTKLNHDLCALSRYLPPMVKIRLRLTRAADNYVLCMAATEDKTYQIHLDGLELSCRQIEVESSVVRQHQLLMEKSMPARFPYLGTECKSFALPQGIRDYTITNAFYPDVPSFLILAFQSSSRFAGEKHLNPLKFSYPPLQSARIIINGSLIREFKCVGGKDKLEEDPLASVVFGNFLDELGFNYTSVTNSLTFESFCQDNFLLAADFSPDQKGNSTVYEVNQLKTGSLNIQLSFWKDLPESYQLILYSTRPKNLVLRGSQVEVEDLL